jgi:hypothetical protein
MIDYKDDPKFWQRFLKCAGFHTDTINCHVGFKSMQVTPDFEQALRDVANTLARFDGRTRK